MPYGTDLCFIINIMQLPDSTFWDWIDSHINDDPTALRLKYPAAKDGMDYPLAITQIECRRKFGKKLKATLEAVPHFLFPSRLAGEQSTSDSLAAFHASLVLPGRDMMDMTAGLGIDAMHCSKVCSSVFAIERHSDVADALTINSRQAGCDNLSVACCDSRDYLQSGQMKDVATIFIDPARRSADGGRVFALTDCEPDVVELLPQLASRCERLVVKMSPMLDISHTIISLGGCSRIIAIGNTTECKELIAVKDFTQAVTSSPVIESITLLADSSADFAYTQDQEQQAVMPPCSVPRENDYLYEPYPAMMKAGALKLIGNHFNLNIFHPNTRLYHSPSVAEGFPGEIFRIERIIDFASKHIKRLHRDYPAISITTRNFGMTADALRHKLGVRDGGNKRLFAITDPTGHRLMLITSKL